MISFEMLAFYEVVKALQERLAKGVVPISSEKNFRPCNKDFLYFYEDTASDNDGCTVYDIAFDVFDDFIVGDSRDAFGYVDENYTAKLVCFPRNKEHQLYSWYVTIVPKGDAETIPWRLDVFADKTYVSKGE